MSWLSKAVHSIAHAATGLVSNTITGATDLAAKAVKVVSPSLGADVQKVNDAAKPVVYTIGAAGAGALGASLLAGGGAVATAGGATAGGAPIAAAATAAPASVAGSIGGDIATGIAGAALPALASVAGTSIPPPLGQVAPAIPPYIAAPGASNAPGVVVDTGAVPGSASVSGFDFASLASNPLAWALVVLLGLAVLSRRTAA